VGPPEEEDLTSVPQLMLSKPRVELQNTAPFGKLEMEVEARDRA